MKRRSKKSHALGIIAAGASAVLALAGCSSASTASSTSTSTSKPASPPAHVTISFWASAAGMTHLVNEFNKTHPNITVQIGAVPSGQAKYEKIQSAVQAGTGPDLALVEYEEVPTLAIAGVLDNVTSQVAKYKSEFRPAAWQQASFLGQQYGLPHDIGPMVMYYNAALFKKAGIPVPQTWAQFSSEAATLKQKTGAAMGSYLNYGLFIAGVCAQNGAHWFGISHNSWQVAINSSSCRKVLNYWTGLTTKGYAVFNNGFNEGYWGDLDAGKIATYIVGAWGYRGLEGNLKLTAGDWRVAPVPQWNLAKPVNSNIGGSLIAVMKGAKHLQADLEFANWLTTNSTALALTYKYSGFYPAAVDGANLSGYSTPDPFFGGQKVGSVYAQAASEVSNNWQWGPVMTTLNVNFQDELPGSITAGSANGMLNTIQGQTISEMKTSGFSVSNG